MSENNEDVKPIRKTWRMLRKTDQNLYIPFTSNIIPTFNNSNTGKDTYGTWSCSDKGNDSGWPSWVMFDKVKTRNICSKAGTGDQGLLYVYLNLPSTIEVSLEEILVQWSPSGAWFLFIDGYDQKTNTWIPIASSTQLTNDVTMVSTNSNYYNKFRLSTYRTDTSSPYLHTTSLTEWNFTKGTIKVIDGLIKE